MSRKGQLLQPGQLMTVQERRELRLLASDLQAQIDRCTDPDRLGALGRQLDSVRRQQREDRALSPRRKRSGAR